MQFWPLFPAQQGQPFMQLASGSQQFRPLGQGMPPGQSQLPQFSQPLQQMSAWPVRPIHTTPSLASPMPFMQPNMTSTSCSPQFQSSATTNNHVSGLGGPGVHLSSSFTFSTSAFGHAQNNASPQFQPVSQMRTPVAPFGGQHWLPFGTQGAPTVTPVAQTGMQHVTVAFTNQAMSVPNVIQEASSDWQEYTSGDGRRYFYNKRTKNTSWEKPSELMTPLERVDASTVWKEFTTAEGKKYYYNKETKQSKWKIPDELELAREQAEKEASEGSQSGMVPQADAPATFTSSTLEQPFASTSSVEDVSLTISGVASSPVAVKPNTSVGNDPPNLGIDSSSIASEGMETPSPVSQAVNGAPYVLVNTSSSPKTNLENSYSHAVANALDGALVQDIKEAKKGISAAGKVNAAQWEVVDVEPVLYASKQEAKIAFKSLLESANLEADCSWEQAMRVIINDKRYGVLKTLGERKRAFNEFLMEKKKLDVEESRLRQKKAKDEFMKMLEECKELTSSMRWSKAIALVEDDKRYKAVERPADREDLFQNYLVDLKKKGREKAQEEQHQKRLEYRRFLESCGLINVNTQWRKVKDRLEDDERCSRLEKIDRLEIFQEYIRDLGKEEEEQRKLKKEQIKTVERKNRDEFRKMMEEHVVSGILTASTQWRDYFQKVKESVAYQAVASNTCGATAKDLFEDVTEELEKKYRDDKTRVKNAMKAKKVNVAPAWTFKDFKAAMQDAIISPPLSDINLQLVFEDLLERAKEKEKKEGKRRRRLTKDFTELLYGIKEINASSTWEECLQLFEESPAYRSVGDESFARVTFEEYVVSLLEKAENNKYKQEEEKAKKEKREKNKDESNSVDVDVSESYGHKDRERKHRRRHGSPDKDDRDDSKKSRRHGSGHRKSRKVLSNATLNYELEKFVVQHAYSPESDGEIKHKRYKKDGDDDGCGKNGGHKELEDGEVGEDGEIC
ncbi:pre-mRNA-processing protein 40A-like isoform X2 [Cynara cardunculus var. scolymus]|uniref:pre-mRNA-processing protein 40A-like isoform X2 n=1 Tax=Cynara cardunculus var. scolymus TaxID=59895 RepID=UPI000D62C4AF|nr:pre-mRNA-processing protein 40A-like isoform X2 [Cynara cardunculus var. scolymus]